MAHFPGIGVGADLAGVTGAVVSMYDIGCFAGAMSTGALADLYGRERLLALASIVCIIGAAIQAGSYTIPQIVRFYGVFTASSNIMD